MHGSFVHTVVWILTLCIVECFSHFRVGCDLCQQLYKLGHVATPSSSIIIIIIIIIIVTLIIIIIGSLSPYEVAFV